MDRQTVRRHQIFQSARSIPPQPKGLPIGQARILQEENRRGIATCLPRQRSNPRLKAKDLR